MTPHASSVAEPARAELTVASVTEALRQVRYPGLTRDLVSFGMVQHVSVCDGRVKVTLGVRTRDASIPAQLEDRKSVV